MLLYHGVDHELAYAAEEGSPPTLSPSRLMPFLCHTENRSGYVDLTVDNQTFHVAVKDIFLMSKCQEGKVDWFSIFEVGKYKSTVQIDSAGGPGKYILNILSKNIERTKEYLRINRNNMSKIYDLYKRDDDGSEANLYIGEYDDDTAVNIGCEFENPAHNTVCTAYTTIGKNNIHVEYYFLTNQLQYWKKIDSDVRSFVINLTRK